MSEVDRVRRRGTTPSFGPAALRGRLALWIAVAAAALAVLLGAAWALAPRVAGLVAPALAPRLGLDALAIEIGRPGWRGLSIARLSLTSGRLRVDAVDGRLEYGFLDLLGGQADRLRFAAAKVTVLPGVPTDTAGALALPAIDPAALFAALPVDAAEIGRVDLRVPAVGFAAEGGLVLDGRSLELALVGAAPQQAVGWLLRFEAGASGRARLRVSERSQSGAKATPLVDFVAEQGAGVVDVAGAVHASGFAFDLVAAIAGLPAGTGSLKGSVRTRLPWPLPEVPDWASLDLEGEVACAWTPAAGGLRLGPFTGRWQLASGILTGAIAGTIGEGGVTTPLTLRAAGLDLTGVLPFGALAATLGPEQRPLLDLEATLAKGAINVSGATRIAEPDWLRLARLTGWLPGRGALSARVRATAPWAAGGARSGDAGWLPEPGAIRGEVTIGSMRWAMDGGVAVMERATGRISFVGPAFEAALDGLARLTEPLPLGTGESAEPAPVVAFKAEMGSSDVRASSFEATGTVRVGAVGPLAVSFRRDAASGDLSVTLTGEQSIDRPLFAGTFEPWSAPWDLEAGRLSVAADLAWPAGGALAGQVSASLADVSAHYGDYAATGLGGDFALALAADGWRLAPADVRADRIVAGVELSEPTARVAGTAERLEVERVAARLFGGELRVGPFELDTTAEAARFDVELAGIDLAQVLALYGERIAGSGLLDGTLPVVLVDGAPTVAAGRLAARSPGGTIRVAQSLAGVSGQPGLDFALRALDDFTYSELSAVVDYAASGDLALAVVLKGRNPSVEDGRPIHYNLNVTENLHQLFESLTTHQRFVDSIERGVTP
jgi:hypothetical protein